MQGAAALRAAEKEWLHTQAIFTLRRYAYGATLALTAMIAETLRWGYTFDQTMASSRAALSPVITGAQDLNAELFHLFNFAKYTPFQFKDITTAFRQMYLGFRPFGISVGETNNVIQAMVDNLSATGRTTPGALNRVAVALQHMANLGHLTGQAVQQLARDGIQIMPALRKELHLTGDDMHRIGALGIPVQQVLDAIVKYTETTPGLMNAAYRQSQTFGGSLTTLKDNISEVMGAMISGPFSHGPSFISGINKTFDTITNQIEANVRAGKGMGITWNYVAGVFESRYPVLRGFFTALNLAFQYAKALANIIANSLLPAIKNAAYTLLPLYILLKLFADILSLVGHHGTVLTWILTILIGNWLVYRQILILVAIKQAIMTALTWAQVTATLVLTAWNERLILSEEGVVAGAGSMGRAQKALVLVTMALGAAVAWVTETVTLMYYAFGYAEGIIPGLAAAFEVLWAAMGPVGWIILIISAIAILGILYWRVKSFRDLVNDTVTWIWRHGWMLGIVFLGMIGPILLVAKAIELLVKHFQTLVRWAKEAWKYTGGAVVGAASDTWKFLGLQEGGTVSRSGIFLVGERGPELVALPGGASVTPGAGMAINTGGGGISLPDINLRSIIQIDGKQVAEAVSRHRLDAAARA
jgi:hypothetical protein